MVSGPPIIRASRSGMRGLGRLVKGRISAIRDAALFNNEGFAFHHLTDDFAGLKMEFADRRRLRVSHCNAFPCRRSGQLPDPQNLRSSNQIVEWMPELKPHSRTYRSIHPHLHGLWTVIGMTADPYPDATGPIFARLHHRIQMMRGFDFKMNPIGQGIQIKSVFVSYIHLRANQTRNKPSGATSSQYERNSLLTDWQSRARSFSSSRR